MIEPILDKIIEINGKRYMCQRSTNIGGCDGCSFDDNLNRCRFDFVIRCHWKRRNDRQDVILIEAN